MCSIPCCPEEESDDVESLYDFFTNIMKPAPFVRKVAIKFTTEDGKVITQAYPENYSIEEVKNEMVEVVGVPMLFMDFEYKEEPVSNTTKLFEYNLPKYSALEFNIFSNNERYQVLGENVFKDLIVPDVITVQIDTVDGGYREVVVEIEHRCIKKPFLGGFRNAQSGLIYHNGYAQTGPLPPKVHPSLKNHRDTQTYDVRNRRVETHYERATQMANEEIWIPTVTDKILTAGPYETAEEREKRLDLVGKVRIIQRYYRAWKMRNKLKELSEEYKKRVRLEKEEEEWLIRDNEIRKKKELIAKVFPRSRKDFAMLYFMVETWKKNEIERIHRHTCGAARIAEIYVLLEKEVELLRAIDRQREVVRKDMLIQKDINFFRAIGDPLEWNSYYKNLFIQMDTLETQQGREYEALYLSIVDKSLPRDQFLENLIMVKVHLEGDLCPVGIELNRLIDRLCILTTRGLSDKDLAMLRKRVEALLMYHFKQPECSAGVTNRMRRVKEKLMVSNLFYCIRCKKLKEHDKFPLHSRTQSFRVCLNCTWDDRTIEPWVDLAPYRYMLRLIRREERRKGSPSSIAFILQDRDIHLLVTKVWHSHSAINECDDIYQLRLVRWYRDEDWAPWNSVLLTEDEAKVHLKVRVLEDVYDQEFLCHVYNKHSLARKYYLNAYGLDCKFQEIGDKDTRWNEILETNRFVAVNSKSKIFLSCH